jgi:hypothetical protein
MFRASLRPSSGATKLQQQPLVYRRSLVIAVLLVVFGPVVVTAQHVSGILTSIIKSYKTAVAASGLPSELGDSSAVGRGRAE